MGLGSRHLLEAEGTAEEVVGGAHGGVELGFAGADALELEDVVYEANETVGVAGRNLEHVPEFLRTGVERTPGDEAESGAQAGERCAELVRDGGDELILHA